MHFERIRADCFVFLTKISAKRPIGEFPDFVSGRDDVLTNRQFY